MKKVKRSEIEISIIGSPRLCPRVINFDKFSNHIAVNEWKSLLNHLNQRSPMSRVVARNKYTQRKILLLQNLQHLSCSVTSCVTS